MLCSVIIPSYNAEKYISHAIGSVLQQSISDIEIIVCDDASIDNTAMIVERISQVNPQVKLLKNYSNKGPSCSRNVAIENSCGEWIALLDADDFYHPSRLEYMIKLGKDQHADLVADNIFITADDNNKTKVAFNGNAFSQASDFQVISTKEFVRRDMPGRHRLKFGFLKPIIRRDFLRKNKLRYDEKIRIGEDFNFYIHCLLGGAKFIFSKQPYYYYRQSPQSLSRSNSKDKANHLEETNRNLIELAKKHKHDDLVKLLRYRQKLFAYYSTYTKMVSRLKNGYIFFNLGPDGKEISFWGFAIRLFLSRLAFRLGMS